jgi:hypothetical protein
MGGRSIAPDPKVKPLRRLRRETGMDEILVSQAVKVNA